MKSRLHWIVGAAICSACANHDQEEALNHLRQWERECPSSYVYVVERVCFCAFVEPVRIVVEDDSVARGIGMETGLERSGQTITELMDMVVELAGDDNATFEAAYDGTLGYVRELTVDGSTSTADDELTIRVTCFGPGTEDSVCPLRTVGVDECPGEALVPNDNAVAPNPCEGGRLPLGRVEGTESVCCPSMSP